MAMNTLTQDLFARAIELPGAGRDAFLIEACGGLRRFLTHKPVTASPPTAGYQPRHFARRSKAALCVAAVRALPARYPRLLYAISISNFVRSEKSCLSSVSILVAKLFSAATAWRKSWILPPCTPHFRARFAAAKTSAADSSTKSRCRARFSSTLAASSAEIRVTGFPVRTEKTSASAWGLDTPRSSSRRSRKAGANTASIKADESQYVIMAPPCLPATLPKFPHGWEVEHRQRFRPG